MKANRLKLKTNYGALPITLSPAMIVLATILALLPVLSVQTADAQSSPDSAKSEASHWSVQVDRVNPGDVNIESAFQVAIYENLLDEMAKTKRFKRVFRSGDRDASTIQDLLILKTTVEKYSAGSETRRAVTTVSGATKLKVRSQISTRDGRIILEHAVDGNVRFFGNNLRATHNLARNVAKAIGKSTLPEPSSATPAQGSNESKTTTAQIPLPWGSYGTVSFATTSDIAKSWYE